MIWGGWKDVEWEREGLNVKCRSAECWVLSTESPRVVEVSVVSCG